MTSTNKQAPVLVHGLFTRSERRSRVFLYERSADGEAALTDSDIPASAICLSATKTVPACDVGDAVWVVNSITAELFRGTVSFCLVAMATGLQAFSTVPDARAEHLTPDTLRRLTPDRRPFRAGSGRPSA